MVESSRYRDDRYERRNRLSQILVWVGIVAGVVFIVAVIFFAGFFIGRNAAAQPKNCQALCVGEQNISAQAWTDCINRCMSPGGVG